MDPVTQVRREVTLLTRQGCPMCDQAAAELSGLVRDFPVDYQVIDVDEVAGERPELRAEYGDRLPVILLDGAEHSYWEVDAARLRADLTR